MNLLLGFVSDKPYKILIKIFNTTKYIKLDIQNIKAPKADDLILQYISENILTGFT